MHWYEVVSYLFVIMVIVLVTLGAFNAFRIFIRGKHHEKNN